MRRSWLGAFLLCTACASAPIRKPDQLALDQADALVRQGCYDCLVEARATYARVAAGKARPLVVGRLFEVELLLSLREKELAMDHQPALDRARALVPELAPALEPERYLAIADAVPPDDMGSPRSELTQFRRARVAFTPKINGEIAWLETAGLGLHFRQYLAHAIDCMDFRRPLGEQPKPWVRRVAAIDSVPLLAYRMGICDFPVRALLDKVRAAEPRFVEAAFFVARLEVNEAARTGKGRPREPLAEAYARFPKSASITYLTGNYNQLSGDCSEALRFYDETLALKPVHELGLLGRTVCLSYLKRTDEAIAAATHMIEVKPFNIDEAYYWRAWNYHLLKDLPPARRDIEAAKARATNIRIHTLAGVIEHDQDDLDIAERDLNEAMRFPGAGLNCTPPWYLGLVEMKRTRWTESGTHFEHAMQCYERSITDSEQSISALEANPDLDPIFRVRQIANFRAQIDSDRSQQYAAAFNAANHYARGGQIPKARVLIEVAARDPGLSDRIAQLKKMIGG